MCRVEELNQYIQQLFDYWEGKNDDFEPIPIPKEVDDERACCHCGTVTQELSQETGRRTAFRPITGGQETGKNQPHRKEAIHENDRTGTTHQNPASEKNVPDKGAKRET